MRGFTCARSYIVLLAVHCAAPVAAHLFLATPTPFPGDAAYLDPLEASGANFPCKGYHLRSAGQVPATPFQAGATVPVTMSGSATHGGGSCQFSLSL